MNTTENNKLIAEFMGAKEVRKDTYKFPNRTGLPLQIGTIKYHSDWNWLMEVVEKIENLTTRDNFVIYDFTIYSDAVIISDQEENPLIVANKSEVMGSLQTEPILLESKIQAVYDVVVLFIKWYNEQNK